MMQTPKTKLSKKEVLKFRREVEKFVSEIIKNTEFYKRYKTEVIRWYYGEFEKILVVSGGYGIGKSRTLRQIFEEENIEYKVVFGRFEYPKEIKPILEDLEETSVVVFDDSFVSRRIVPLLMEYMNRGVGFAFVVNHEKELRNIEKLVWGRSYPVSLYLSKDDLEYLKREIEEKFNIEVDDIILNIRDLVNLIVTKKFGIPTTLTIERIVKKHDSIRKNYEKLKQVIKKVYEYTRNKDEDLYIEIAIKVFGYSESTARKYVKRILTEISHS